MNSTTFNQYINSCQREIKKFYNDIPNGTARAILKSAVCSGILSGVIALNPATIAIGAGMGALAAGISAISAPIFKRLGIQQLPIFGELAKRTGIVLLTKLILNPSAITLGFVGVAVCVQALSLLVINREWFPTSHPYVYIALQLNNMH